MLFVRFSCPAGTSIQTTPCSGSGGCLGCLGGSYCPGGLSDSIPCPVGTYSYPGAVSLASCLPCQITCLPGYYNVTAPVGAGSFGTCNVCTVCPPGYFCNHNMITACKINSYNANYSASDVSNCTHCPTGSLTACLL